MNAQQIRRELRNDPSVELRRRRAIIGLSLVGMAAMPPVCVLQTGLVRHLPDLPVRGVDSDGANLSDTAYRLGIPDGTLALASLAANIPVAAWGGAERAREQPWLSLGAAAKAVGDAVGAGSYFWQMLTGREPWCPYCITAALAIFGIAGLTLAEAATAIPALPPAKRQ